MLAKELKRQIVLTREEIALASDAIPLNYDDLGSDRQVASEVKWHSFLKTQLSPEAMEDLEDYALGATIEETVFYGLGVLANTDRTMEDK